VALFSQNKDSKVRGVVLKLVNTSCPGLQAQLEDARVDARVNLSIVLMVIPLKDGKIQIDEGFTAVTKDFSNLGLAVILEHPVGLDKVVLGFRMGDEMLFLRAEAKHLNPMGGGFFQLGFRLLEVVSTGDYPGLASLRL
jgi:hypothetical protein